MKYCSRPFRQAYIFPNGDVRACGWTYQKIGNLLEQSMEEIWHSQEAERVRDGVRDGSFCTCNKVVCPFLANDSLPDIPEDKFNQVTIASDLPAEVNAAYDYICNHSCPSCRHEIFCPDEQYKNNMNTITEKLLPVLNQATKISTDGNGDAFASPHIMHMLESINPEKDEFSLVIETNGVLSDENHWKHLSHMYDKYIKVIVTPNSFNRGVYKYLSGGHDNLEVLIHNLHYLKKLRKDGIINQFEVSIVVQDTNFRELPEFTKRCIEEFECDKVVIKPVFHWFSLTPEEYWFKDILNPKHPYFSEYMEILKDPMLKHPKVFFWGGDEIHKPKEHPAMQYKKYFDAFARILQMEEPNKALEGALHEKSNGKVAIYGVNDMAQMLYNILKKTDIQVVGFIDRDAQIDEFCGLPVTKFDTYRPDMVDTILVSNFQWLTNVTRDLRFRDFKGNIIPFDKILPEE